MLIDYTHPTLIRHHLDVAFARGVPVVIGTTGLSDADFEQIDEAARTAGLGAVTGNFAITAALLQHLAKFAAAHVPHWEVVEYNKASKPDVPSGTARELAELLGRVRQPADRAGDDELIGPLEARGAEFGGARVHSIRLPGYGAGRRGALRAARRAARDAARLRRRRQPSSCTAPCSPPGASSRSPASSAASTLCSSPDAEPAPPDRCPNPREPCRSSFGARQAARGRCRRERAGAWHARMLHAPRCASATPPSTSTQEMPSAGLHGSSSSTTAASSDSGVIGYR